MISAQKLNRELNLAQKGEEDGKNNLPRAEATSLSETEAAVVNRVEAELANQSKAFIGAVSASDFSSLPQELETIASEPQTILTQFRGKKARAQSATQIELAHAQTDFERANRGYRAFRIQHGLTEREPTYDTVFWRKAFWLTLLFSIEVAVNGWVIGQASPGGLVQGWTTALLISVLVVLTGTLIGMGPWRYLFFRGKNGTGRFHLLWAVPLFALGAVALVFFAFYVAHYRFALSHTTLEAPVPDNILTSILTTPFGPFEQLESLILFVVALLIGVFAVARGAFWDDPYPGYGPLHRAIMEERERTQALALALGQQIDAAKDAADEAMSSVSSRSQKAIGALREALSRAEGNAASWDRVTADILEAGREGIELYRDANREHRDAPEPGYFSTDPFRSMAPPSGADVIDSLENALARATSNITQCKSQLAGARAQLEAEYQSFYEDELSPFLKGVSSEAVARVRNEFADPVEEADVVVEEVVELEPDEPPRQDILRLRGGRRR